MKLCYLGESKQRYSKQENFAVKFPVDKMQEDDNKEGYVNEDLGPPQKAPSMKEAGKNTDGNKEDGCVNDDMVSPEKVHMNIK